MRNRSQHPAHRLSTALAAALLITAVGCGEDFNEVETPDNCSEADSQDQLEAGLQADGLCEAEVFVDVDELEFLRQNSNPIILDARAERGQFEGGHIPGAKFAAWGEHRDDSDTLWDDDDKLEESIQAMGVEADRTVLVYGAGDGSGGDSVAGNLYWTLEYVGHDDVYLVNGGLHHWTQANYAAQAGGEVDVEPTDFEIERNEELHAEIDDLRDAIGNDDTTIIDTRRTEEWTGDNERNNPEGGHIPEAVHYHWEDVFQDGDNSGLLRPADELEAELVEVGIDPDTDPLPYCQSGVRSGYFYAVLKWLDAYEDPVNYDGSWFEWSRNADDDEIIVPEDGEAE